MDSPAAALSLFELLVGRGFRFVRELAEHGRGVRERAERPRERGRASPDAPWFARRLAVAMVVDPADVYEAARESRRRHLGFGRPPLPPRSIDGSPNAAESGIAGRGRTLPTEE